MDSDYIFGLKLLYKLASSLSPTPFRSAMNESRCSGGSLANNIPIVTFKREISKATSEMVSTFVVTFKFILKLVIVIPFAEPSAKALIHCSHSVRSLEGWGCILTMDKAHKNQDIQPVSDKRSIVHSITAALPLNWPHKIGNCFCWLSIFIGWAVVWGSFTGAEHRDECKSLSWIAWWNNAACQWT